MGKKEHSVTKLYKKLHQYDLVIECSFFPRILRSARMAQGMVFPWMADAITRHTRGLYTNIRVINDSLLMPIFFFLML